ncbi:zinc ABC transporter substrate-binding protein [Bacillus sp. JJ1533]|uniref:metal ABC transporter solute-binding protein, Zn/Mn family n=1 Tax=Bacillus sp. JJ1533 TaxID=3122959 RepID=UPI002FFE7E74
MKNVTIFIVLIGFLMLLIAGCSNTDKANSGEGRNELHIYTTIYPLQYFTERIGGEFVTVENITPPGTDAHSVEITTKTMAQVAESDAFIHTGTGLEGFADSVAEALENEDVIIVNATEGVTFVDSKEEEESHDDHNEHKEEDDEEGHDKHSDHGTDIDPHVWIDPIRSISIAENIKDKLIDLKPNNKQNFESNFSKLKAELEELDLEFKNMISNTKTKSFVVSHSAYGYWEDAYGVEQIGISGLSPTDEPSQKKLTELIDFVEKNNIKYIFFESNMSNKVAEMVKNETGTEPLTLHNLESISNEDVNDNKNYFVIMRENIEALEKALN